MGLIVGKYIFILLIVAFSVGGLLELDGFKVGFIVTTWTILFVSISIKARCHGCVWFYQKKIGSRRVCYLVFGRRR